MPVDVIVALITVGGTALSAFFGVIVAGRLTNYRISQLEKKVELHNTVVERMIKVEVRLDNLEDRYG
jgi:hypothetical protein